MIFSSYLTDFSCFPLKTFLKITGHGQNKSKMEILKWGVDGFSYLYFNWFSVIIPPLYCNHLVRPSVCPSVHTFVTIISASTGRNDFILDIWLWHGDVYRVSPFQVYRTSTSCLQCDLEFFMFAIMKTFVTVISASTGRNNFIFDIWLLHGDLYHDSPFQVYRTSTSCLQCDLEFFMFAIMKTFVTVISASTGRNNFIFDIWLLHGDLYRVSPFLVYRTYTSCLPCDLQMIEWGYS
jgi:hypothetical protein